MIGRAIAPADWDTSGHHRICARAVVRQAIRAGATVRQA
jgi:hypothetical protein